MRTTPPKYALKFLRWFCREDFLDEVEGDLTELFEKQYQNSLFGARWRFMLSVVRYLRPEYMKIFHKTTQSQSLFNLLMIRNYFSLALRNLRRRAAFSFINIFGLAMGVCACLIILKYIDFEISYDKFNVNASSIYRINRTSVKNEERMPPVLWTTHGLGPALQTDIPEVRRYIRTHTEEAVVTYHPSGGEARGFHEHTMLAVDSTFFRAFTFNAIRGNLILSLDKPNSIVLTQTAAKKYFGSTDPIGETLTVSGGRMKGSYTVTAVMEDVPQNSHFVFDFLLPLHNMLMSNQYKNEDGWGSNNFITYVQLHNESKYESAELKLPELSKRRLDPKWKEHNIHMELHLQPLRNIHLTPGLRGDGETISHNTLYFFGVIAAFILCIAWINYINLSTARAMERAREVGVRKAIGAFRSELVTQFLLESVVINVIGIVLAVGLATAFLPVLERIIGKQLSFDFGDIRLWSTLGVLFIVGTLASGIYPAVVMSSFRATNGLKKGQGREGGSYVLRKALVVFQFAASLILIAGTFVVYRQINYMQAQDKGLTMDQMLVVNGPRTIPWDAAKQTLRIFKQEAEKIPGVKAITTSGAVPGGGHNWGADVRKSGVALSEIKLGSVVWIDPDFIPLYDISFLSGRNFNTNIRSDMESVIINEASLEAFGLGTASQALGEQLIFDKDTAHIIGVVKNYNWSSLKSEVKPFIFMADTIVPSKITFQLESKLIPPAIEAVGKLYKTLIPDEPYDYNFLDESFNTQYKSDQQFGNIFGVFAGLAVAISCLGLWGLASFTTSQRLKEIGVRKVLGATVGSIVYLLSAQFLKLVVLAALIALPMTWYGMSTWLNNFAFKISLQWDLFLIPVVLLTLTALLTVSLQVLKGATMNPAKILRSE
jgi:putative ABC transport system permease protein